MFLISTLIETVPVVAPNLSKSTAVAVQEVLEALYLDKVVPNLGLGVTIYNILEIKGGFVYPSDSSAYFEVKFELVVFRPVKGEVIVGKVAKCDRSGVQVTLGFFSDIFVPEFGMQQPSFFKNETSEWFWKADSDELYIETMESIRLRVTDVRFRKAPTPGDMKRAITEREAAVAAGTEGNAEAQPVEGTVARPFAPMLVMGSICEDGLGMTAWWAAPEGSDEEQEADGEEAEA